MRARRASERIKTVRQPLISRTKPMSGGASTEPTAVPALIMPIAVDRFSRFDPFRHDARCRRKASALARAQQEARDQPEAESRGQACRAQASDHHSMMSMKPRRVPSTSSRRPPITYIAA